MGHQEREPFTREEWERFEDELVERAREITRVLADQLRRAVGRSSPDDQPGEVPVFG